MNIDQWMQQNPGLVYEEFGDLSISKLARLIDDEIALGTYLREQIEKRYEYEMSAQTIERPMIDTDKAEDARAINAESRRVYG